MDRPVAHLLDDGVDPDDEEDEEEDEEEEDGPESAAACSCWKSATAARSGRSRCSALSLRVGPEAT